MPAPPPSFDDLDIWDALINILSIPLCNGALTFGEEFFIYTQSSQFGDSARYYRLEGSSLDKISEK